MHTRHGELLGNGFHVGDVALYDGRDGARYAVVMPGPYEGTDRLREYPWGFWSDTVEEAEENYQNETRRDPNCTGPHYSSRATLFRSYEGSSTMTAETTEPVVLEFHGEPIRESMRATSIEEGREYRLIYPRDHHNMELLARATRSRRELRQGTSLEFEVISWPRPSHNRSWSEEGSYPAGSTWRILLELRPEDYSYVFIIPAGVTGFDTSAATDSAYDGTPGEFVPHNGQIPEPGTIVRGMGGGGERRQFEGLFLAADVTAGVATIEAKRRRDMRHDGTFTEWQSYQNAARRSVQVEGATVFKAGAAAQPTLVRVSAITNEEAQLTIAPGMILSSRAEYGREIYRGEVLSVSRAGGVRLRATEKAAYNSGATGGAYKWETIPSQEVDVHCVWSDGRNAYDSAGWIWERTGAPNVKRVDPAFDPNRKTAHTGMKIGDLVVGLMRENEYGRDTVSSWAKGEIVKWDTRYGRPIMKVTDPMESNKKVGDEVQLVNEDVYPAMADPATVSPEEYKKTLRAYLIGRHKRGDFCRGGLNTMLAAHGIPLYETRRHAKMVVTVDYDPNTTDLHTVARDLRTKLAGVQGLSFSERSGEEIELTVESDVTAG